MNTAKRRLVAFHLDNETARELKSVVALEDKTIRQALAEATKEWLRRRQAPRNHENTKSDRR